MPQTRDLRQQDAVEETPSPTIPSVDFDRLLTSADEVQKLRDTCRQTGFVTVNNALQESTAISQAMQQMHRFFALPDSDPMKRSVSVRTTGCRYGWTPLFDEPAYQPDTLAYVESFDFGRGGENVWPDLPGFRADMKNCWDVVAAIGDSVLEALALAAGLDRLVFASRCASRELSTMRLLHYPENHAPMSKNHVGIAAHTDFECMTLLLQNAPGLELRNRAGQWFDAPSDRNQVVVLLGDMIERWTNGYFQATGHRVRNSNEKRMSIVMFFAVDDSVSVAPLPDFTTADRPSMYAPVSQRAHLAAEVSRAERNRDNQKE
ncbi:MAG: isopenicillin N synthase family dioxygenase [Woeseiaceae bacterium]